MWAHPSHDACQQQDGLGRQVKLDLPYLPEQETTGNLQPDTSVGDIMRTCFQGSHSVSGGKGHGIFGRYTNRATEFRPQEIVGLEQQTVIVSTEIVREAVQRDPHLDQAPTLDLVEFKPDDPIPLPEKLSVFFFQFEFDLELEHDMVEGDLANPSPVSPCADAQGDGLTGVRMTRHEIPIRGSAR